LFYWATLSGITVPAILFVVFFSLWLARRDPLPSRIRIATGVREQSYHVFGQDLCGALNSSGERRAMPIETTGTAENIQLLARGDAELSLYQGGTFPLDECGIVAPLYPEVVHVLVDASLLKAVGEPSRKDLNASVLRDISQTKGQLDVFAGAKNSGMRQSADEILLQHYKLNSDALNFVDRSDADVVISTTGIFSDAMLRRLGRGDYRIATILTVLSTRHL
jgi:TRAP-type uncharacterized transport system substrate-binding protein